MKANMRGHLLVVLGVVVLALGACGASPAVTASTPPDTVHLVVTRLPRDGTPSTTVYDHTYTDAATARQIADVLNAAPDKSAVTTLPWCGADGSNVTPEFASFPWFMYRFTLSANGGQTVERVDESVRCGGVGIRRGFAPAPDTLGVEVGPNIDMMREEGALVSYLPPRSDQPPPGTRVNVYTPAAWPPTPTPLP
jgi:hypothetical protein